MADEPSDGEDSEAWHAYMEAFRARQRKRPREKVKPKGNAGQLHPVWRMSFPDDEDGTGRGKVEVGLPGYGVWRRVPGFSKILASDQGYIMTQGAIGVRTQTQCKHTFYWRVGCNGLHERVHSLVCRAFHGPAREDHTSVDHHGGKELSPEERRSDNSASNLAWATRKEQAVNRKKPKPNSHGEPCVVWRVQGGKRGTERSPDYMTPIGPEVSYSSLSEAATALGLDDGSLSKVFLGKLKTVPTKEGVRYTGRWQERDEANLDGEEWKQHSSRLWVSTHGRIQTKSGRGERWSPKRVCSKLEGSGYMRVMSEGKTCRNTSVFISF